MELTLKLTVEETNVVLAGLGELPAKAAMSVIQKIQQQAGPQVQKQPEAVEEEGA